MTADSDTVPSDFLGDVGQLCVIHQALISRKARPSVPVGEQVFHRLADIKVAILFPGISRDFHIFFQGAKKCI